MQIAIVAVGIGEIIFRFPQLFSIFKVICAVYLLYLAWRFYHSSGVNATEEVKFGFREGALLQIFNLKALSVPLIMYTQFLDHLLLLNHK
ncbi:MAG: hypothetical protein DWQ04_16655 [Chloroflexi bacterium]|nr:MAG: hypothetical protein DWQ04_16655 [Chloroflexota bacterium]